MTPLIQEMVRVTPDPESGHWFDLGDIPSVLEYMVDPPLIVRLPYATVFIVARSGRSRTVVRAEMKGEVVTVTGFSYDNQFLAITPFAYKEKDNGLAIYPAGISKDNATHLAIGIITTLLRRLDSPQTAYQATVKETFTNRRKIAQGKKPSYDWRTVTVLPERERSEPQGGTHASPREHDRRGHWRTLKTKRVWVRPCKVGNPAQGRVFHDYKVPDET
jgi:hypothetical protein